MAYQKDSLGNEYYALPEYAKKADKTEIYAVKNGSQFYLANQDGIETMAKKPNLSGTLIPYFALDAEGVPICPILELDQKSLNMNIQYFRNNQNKKVYPKRWNREYYISTAGKMKYARNEDNTEYYATDSNGTPYYAAKTDANGDLVQYPIVDSLGKNIYIEENGIVIYPINLTKNIPVYEVNEEGKELYLEKNDIQYYGRNTQKLPIYAKEKQNDYFALRNGNEYYSFYETNGTVYQYYPKLQNKNEFYLTEKDKEIYAKFDSDERYAQTVNKTDILANSNGIAYYATDKLNAEFYPISDGTMFYRNEYDIEKVALNKSTNEGFYARNKDMDEFYPKNFNKVPEVNVEVVDYNLYREPTTEEIAQHISSSS